MPLTGELFSSWSDSTAMGLLSSCRDGILLADGPEGKISYINPALARLLQAREEQLLGLRVGEILQLNNERSKAYPITGGQAAPEGLICRAAALDARPWWLLLRPRDEEELESLRQRLDAINALGDIAHEFNNLLTAIMGFNQLAAVKLEPSHPARRDLAQADVALDRARLLMSSLANPGQEEIGKPRSQRTVGRGYSLWLLPAEPWAGTLGDWNKALVKKLGGEIFPPHMTLLAGFQGEEKKLEKRTLELARTLPVLAAEVMGTNTTEAFFQALFLDLRPTANLAPLRDRAMRLFGYRPEGPFRPHLSLLYADLPEGRKQAALEGLDRKALKTLTFDRLCLQATRGPVDRWRPLATFPLTGSGRGQSPS